MSGDILSGNNMLQYVSLTGPVVVPAADFNPAHHQPITVVPAWVTGKKSVQAASQQTAAWDPKLWVVPDFHNAEPVLPRFRYVSPQLMQVLGWNTDTPAAPITEAWYGHYADSVFRFKVPASSAHFAWNTDTPFSIDNNAAWSGHQPSFIWRTAQTRIGQFSWHTITPLNTAFAGATFVQPFMPPIRRMNLGTFTWNTTTPFQDTNFAWKGYQADRVDRTRIRIASIPTLAWNIDTPAPQAVPEFFGQFTDMVKAYTGLGAAYGPFYGGTGQIGTLAEVSWNVGQQPSQVWSKKSFARFQPQPILGDFFTGAPDVPFAVWRTTYPDLIRNPRMRMPQFIALGLTPALVMATRLQPLPIFPDRLHRCVRPILAQSWTPPQETQIHEAWLSHFPAFVQRNSIKAAWMPAAWLGSFGTISIPDTSWNPTYPAWMPPLKLRHYDIQMNLDPIPNPPAPELSWGPLFADFAVKSRIHASTVPAAWWNTITPPRTPYEWTMQHQMPARRTLRPRPDFVRAYDTSSAIAPEAWHGLHPDFISRRVMHERPAMFNPPLSTFPALTVFGWRQQHVPFVRLRKAHVWSMLPFTVEPSIIANQYDCIVIDDTDVMYSTLTAETVKVSTFTSETVTPTVTGDFC